MARRKPLQRSGRDLQLLAIREILRAIAAALSLDEILSVIANMTIIVSDATTSWFMLAEDGWLRIVVARGELAESLAGAACEVGSTSCGVAASGSVPVVLWPAQVDAADAVLGVLAGCERPVVLLPLRADGQLLGVLGSVVVPQATADLSFLLIAAEQAAGAIQSAWLREETHTWRRRLDAVFERMAEAVLIYDQEGRLVLTNAAGVELLGAGNAQLGDSIAELTLKAGLCDVRGQPLRPEQTGASRALRGERVDNLEENLRSRNGTLRHLLVSAVPLGSDGQVQGAVVVYRDITYIKELERMRAEFLSMVSHELRTPLTSILGYAQLLQRQSAKHGLPQEVAKPLAAIVEQSRRVNALVEDLLETSQVEAGRLHLSREPIDLSAIIYQTARDAAVLAPEYRFIIDVPPEVPSLWADPRRIEQVLRNLFDNAVKFSPPGTQIALTVAVEKDHVAVSLSDQGMGIAKGDIPALFMPFHRVRQAEGREVKGVGLGLYISRSIVEAHGGALWVESQLGKGSTFHFSLPLAGGPPREF